MLKSGVAVHQRPGTAAITGATLGASKDYFSQMPPLEKALSFEN